MHIIPHPWIVRFVAAGLSALLWLPTAHALLSVRVRGSARLEADVGLSADGENLNVRGRLRDELGEPISAARVRLEQSRGQSAALPLEPLTPCNHRQSVSAGAKDVETDASGAFCAQLTRAQLQSAIPLRVVFGGNDVFGAASATVELDDPRAGLTIDFGQLPHVISLDSGDITFVLQLQPITPNAQRDAIPLSLALTLHATRADKADDIQLQRLQARIGAPVSVTIPATSLGRPGPAELVLSFDGNNSYKPLRSGFGIERVTTVKLTVADWPESATRGERFSFTVRAMSAIGLPPPGFVEVAGFDGVATLFALDRNGAAAAVVEAPSRSGSNRIEVRFQPSTTGWRAEPPRQLFLQLKPASRLSHVGWVVAALLVFAWFSWTRRRAEAGSAVTKTAGPPRPYAHLEIIESSSDPNAGWSGVVVDAHEGVPIAGATLQLYLPSFDGQQLLFTAISDPLGSFEVPSAMVVAEGRHRLELSAPGFARLSLALPPVGRMRVHLVSARRAILDRLVAWTKRRGQPFDSKAEPSPEWVAEVARVKGLPGIEAWARAVSVAAFGIETPAHTESSALLPPAGASGSLADAKRKDLQSNG